MVPLLGWRIDGRIVVYLLRLKSRYTEVRREKSSRGLQVCLYWLPALADLQLPGWPSHKGGPADGLLYLANQRRQALLRQRVSASEVAEEKSACPCNYSNYELALLN